MAPRGAGKGERGTVSRKLAAATQRARRNADRFKNEGDQNNPLHQQLKLSQASPDVASRIRRRGIGEQERAENPNLSVPWAETNPPQHYSSGRTLAEKMRARKDKPIERAMPGKQISFTPRKPNPPTPVEAAESVQQGYHGPGNREGIQEQMYQKENPYGEFPTREQLSERGVATTDNPLPEIDEASAAKAGKSFIKYNVKDPQQAGEVEEFIKNNPDIMKKFIIDHYLQQPGRYTKGGSSTGLPETGMQEPKGFEDFDPESTDPSSSPVLDDLPGAPEAALLSTPPPRPDVALERQQAASPLVRRVTRQDAPDDLMARKIAAVAEMMGRRDKDIERNKKASPTVPGIGGPSAYHPVGAIKGKKTYVKPDVFKGDVAAVSQGEIDEIAGEKAPNPERYKGGKSQKKVRKGPREKAPAREGGDTTDYREGWRRLSAKLRERTRTPKERSEGPSGVGKDSHPTMRRWFL